MPFKLRGGGIRTILVTKHIEDKSNVAKQVSLLRWFIISQWEVELFLLLSAQVGSLEYMAPEVLQKHTYSYASDVYAFAVTLNEIATGTYPFSDTTKAAPDVHTVLEMGYGRQELATAAASEGLRPSLPVSDAPPGYTMLMKQCWDPDPKRRPTFAGVCDALTTMLQQIGQHGEEVLDKPHLTAEAQKTVWHLMGPLGIGLGKENRLGDHPGKKQDAAAKAVDHMEFNKLSIQLPEHIVPFGEVKCIDVYMPTVAAGAFASAGLRGSDRMEDRHCIVEQFLGLANATLLGELAGGDGPEPSATVFAGMLLDLPSQALP